MNRLRGKTWCKPPRLDNEKVLTINLAVLKLTTCHALSDNTQEYSIHRFYKYGVKYANYD